VQQDDRNGDRLVELGTASTVTQGMGGPRFDVLGPAPLSALDDE